MCHGIHTHTVTVVAEVLLQCISCIYECSCMSDGLFIQFVCQVFDLMDQVTVVQIEICQRFICIVFVDIPHNSNEDKVELDFPVSFKLSA